MVNISAVLKDLIRRLARKEVKAVTGGTKKAAAQYRRDIASLKRQVQDQQKEIKFLKTQETKRIGQPQAAEGPVEGARFSARSVRAQRKRLKLSAQQFAKLIGVSSLTVYNWEHGKSRPREAQFAALVSVRELGRREALKKLELLEGGSPAKKAR
jgi:DNA-binding transcriptional regulator YiaG